MLQSKMLRARTRELRGWKRRFDPAQWEIRELPCDDGVRRLAAVYKPTGEATFNPEIVISVTGAGILRARENHPDMTLAQMYDEVTMPGDLLTAHQLNDRAVMEAYGLPVDATEAEIVAALMRRYQELKEGEENDGLE